MSKNPHLNPKDLLDNPNYYKNMNRFLFPSVLKMAEKFVNQYNSDLNTLHQEYRNEINEFYLNQRESHESIKPQLIFLSILLFLVIIITLSISNIADTLSALPNEPGNFGSPESKVNRNFYFLLLTNLILLATETIWVIRISKDFSRFLKK